MWALQIHNPNGTLRQTLTPNDPVHSIEWHTAGHGDCLEATITGRGLDLRPRDIVAILARDHANDANPPKLRYIGWVVEVPARRNPGLTTTRLMGGRKRLEEVITAEFRLGLIVGANDVATMAIAANTFVDVNTPEGGTRFRAASASIPGTAPLQGFTAGPRWPQLETVAETLDALRLLVPGFTVEPSTTYTYDGRTYTAGQEVPPTEFGVMAHTQGGQHRAQVYFRRPNPTPQTLNELTDNLTIEWLPRSAEQVVDDVTVVLLVQHNADVASMTSHPELNEYNKGMSLPVSWRYKHNGAPYGAALRVSADGDGWKTVDWALPHASAGWSNPANAFDGNPATYASSDDVWPATLSRRAVSEAVFWRIRYSSYIPVKITITRNDQFITGLRSEHIWTLPSTDGAQADRWLQAPSLGDWLSTFPALITISSDIHDPEADEIRIYEVTPYGADYERLDQIAAGHVVLPGTGDAAAITIPNRLAPIAWRWQIALAAGGTFTGVAELIHHRIAADTGLTTTVHIGQGLDSQAASARALLDSRVRQAVRAGTRITL